jgi:hypothetical protein
MRTMTTGVASTATASPEYFLGRLDNDDRVTNNNRPDAATIARLAASLRTEKFDPTKGRGKGRNYTKRRTIR